MNEVVSKLTSGDLLAGRYLVVSKIGVGGMGSVYLAEDAKLPGKRWAVKESLRHARDPRGFADEAEVLARLEHPFIPKLVDFYPPDDEGYSYLIMDYVRGKTLDTLFAENRRELAVARVVKYAVQLCELFDYLHAFVPKPIIYRDLKPANVMIDEQDNVRLIDFGVARHYSSDRLADTVQLGTVGFAAPEQFRGLQTDARTDLYTLGSSMFYLLSGGKCYSGDPAMWRQMRRDVPEWLSSIVRRLLSVKPEDRYQTAGQLKQALECGADGKEDGIQRDLSPPSPRSFERKLVVVGGLYAGAGATFVAKAIARALHHAGVPHAFVEAGVGEGELYSALALHTEGELAFSSTSFTDKGAETNAAAAGRRSSIRRIDGMTEWVAIPPGAASEWTSESCLRLLVSLSQPIVIVDVSSYWTHEAVAELCAQAHEIVVVVGPNPSKWDGRTARSNLELLGSMSRSGKGASMIANRDVPTDFRGEWLSSLPQKPLCLFPELPSASVLEAEWRGRMIFDDPAIRVRLDGLLKPFLSRLLPANEPRFQRKRNILTRWFG
ncbi:serine/threonine protein kinase [Paenibacillus sp. MBLB4367]|uniref:serine/threonine protein kinase n=1 Tax=Paenibacillus sp. MBLB4367 TaxID=3384767 RepID=UPI003908158D